MNNTPFKFLDSYTKEDKDIFFGRESEVEEIYTKIFQSKILLVYGASGTGKSSLISCGLANKFQDTDWLPVNVRRGLEISESLRQQLEKKIFTPLPSSSKASISKTLKSVYLDHFKPIFLIFDQFEELFIFGDRDEWMKFVSIVREVIDSDLQVRFVFIIRGEYLEHLTDFELILPEIFGNRIRIEKMTRTNAVSCIVGPCQSFGIEVEQHFPEDLLTKLSPNKAEIELTYLQVFLDRIFKKSIEKSIDKKIIFSNVLLNELGNIGDVLSQFLDEQIALMSNSEQALAVLKAFVSTDATKKQISTQQAAEFVKTIGQRVDDIETLIQELVNRRILKDKDDSGRYEFRHDSIAAKIFEKITSYERDLIEANQFITYAFSEHNKRNFLLNESDLAYIAPHEAKLNLSAEMRKFLEKSKTVVKKKNRSRKQFYTVMGIISLLLLTSILGLVYSQIQKTEATKNAELARQQSGEALKQKELAEQQRSLAEQKQLEADKQSNIAQEKSALAFAEKQEADRQRSLANALRLDAEAGQKAAIEEKVRADSAKLDAERFSKLANNNAQLAGQERVKAERFRMLAIAQAMGVKASQLQETDQKVLVARQAYLFNQQYQGYAYQSDIYSGLYSAYEALKGDQFNTTPVHQNGIKGLLSISNKKFITVGADGKIFRVDLNTSPPTITLIDKQPYVFQSAAISLDKKLLAVGSEGGRLLLYEVESSKKLKEIDAHKGGLWAIEFDPFGNLYTAGSDQVILRWSMGTYDRAEILKASSLINSLSYNNKRNTLAAGLANGEVVLLRISDQGAQDVGKIPAGKPVTKVKYNTTGNLLAIGKEDGSILLWNAAASEVAQPLTGHRAMVSDLRFSADDSFLASASYDGTTYLWNMKEINQRQIVIADHGGWVLQACFDPDGTHLTTADATGAVHHFSINMAFYANDLCGKIKRNLTEKEWSTFVGEDIPYSKTCEQ